LRPVAAPGTPDFEWVLSGQELSHQSDQCESERGPMRAPGLSGQPSMNHAKNLRLSCRQSYRRRYWLQRMAVFLQRTVSVAPALTNTITRTTRSESMAGRYMSNRSERINLTHHCIENNQVVWSGKVRTNVNQRFALKDAVDAHKALEARATSGSTILTI
jgi:hypothetical protein